MNFFIGQRVRVVYSLKWPELAGTEGRVLSTLVDAANPDLGHWNGYEVGLDAWGGASIAPDSLCRFTPEADQIEPILPSGAQPSEFTTLHDLLESLEGVAA